VVKAEPGSPGHEKTSPPPILEIELIHEQ